MTQLKMLRFENLMFLFENSIFLIFKVVLYDRKRVQLIFICQLEHKEAKK